MVTATLGRSPAGDVGLLLEGRRARIPVARVQAPG